MLEYIRVAKITDAKELDTLLCHCQNKLAGNIDGTELKLSRSGDDEELVEEKRKAYNMAIAIVKGGRGDA